LSKVVSENCIFIAELFKNKTNFTQVKVFAKNSTYWKNCDMSWFTACF